MGTIIIVVTYKRGVRVSEETYEFSGATESAVMEAIRTNIKKKGWKISDQEIIQNTFH